MKKILLTICLAFGLMFNSPVSANSSAEIERLYQNDADILRLEHLIYWTGLIEEYYKKNNSYPLQNALTPEKSMALVRIATAEQRRFIAPGSQDYKVKLDVNADNRFSEISMKRFVSELETGLGREIDEKYDMQQAPTRSPIGYNYFATNDGYVFWVTCITCGVTPVSTLLMDGFTPTVNVASENMVDKVTKAYTRHDMLNHPSFIKWGNKKFLKEEYARMMEKTFHRETKR